MKSLTFPESLQEETWGETASSSKLIYPMSQRSCPADSSLSIAQFSRLIADYRRAGHELAEYWRQTAFQQ